MAKLACLMLPELVKVIKEKDVENLSGVMRSVLLIGVILWVLMES